MNLRAFSCVIWTEDPSAPPVRRTLQARDEADATRYLLACYGDGARCEVWDEEWLNRRASARRPLPVQEREYRAIVWTSDPTLPGRRTTVWALSVADARRQLQEEFGDDICCVLQPDEEASQPRSGVGGVGAPAASR